MTYPISYPVVIQSRAAFVAELAECESGRHEDAETARTDGDLELIADCGYECVVNDFLFRHNAKIELRSQAELDELHYALTSGTIGMYKERATDLMIAKLDNLILTGCQTAPKTTNKVGKVDDVTAKQIIGMFGHAVNEQLSQAAHIFVVNPIPDAAFSKMVIKYSKSRSVTTSTAEIVNGIPSLKFAIADIVDGHHAGKTSFQYDEYDSIKNHRLIGSCTGDINVYISCLVSHELAHIIQDSIFLSAQRSKDTWNGIEVSTLEKPHGQGWREIYSRLRLNLANKLPTYQSITATKSGNL